MFMFKVRLTVKVDAMHAAMSCRPGMGRLSLPCCGRPPGSWPRLPTGHRMSPQQGPERSVPATVLHRPRCSPALVRAATSLPVIPDVPSSGNSLHPALSLCVPQGGGNVRETKLSALLAMFESTNVRRAPCAAADDRPGCSRHPPPALLYLEIGPHCIVYRQAKVPVFTRA